MKKINWKEISVKYLHEITQDYHDMINNNECNGDTKVEFICQNKEFNHPNYLQTLYSHIIKKSGCPKCGREKFKNKLRRRDYPFMQEITEEWQEKIKNGKVSSRDRVEFICQKNSMHPNYMQILDSHLRGQGCPECAKEKKHELFVRRDYPFMDEITEEWQEKIRNGDCVSKTKVEFICKGNSNHPNYMQSLENHLYQNQGCPKCNSWDSKLEKELAMILSEYTIVIQNSRTIIPPYEIDIYLPEYKIGIEFNGIYWHSTKMDTNINVHLNKTNLCKKQEIQLIHIWENEYEEKKECVINLILSKCNLLKRDKIGARECIIKKIKNIEKEQFLEKYHIQGTDSGSIGYGLFYNNVLQSIITLKKQPKNTYISEYKNTYILSRYASKEDAFIIGGFQKLMKFCERTYNIEKWISFGDLRFVNQNDNIYIRNEWIEDSILKPDYMYFYKWKAYHKFNFRLKRFKEDKNLLYEEGLTEKQLAELNNIYRLYDCGKIKYVKYVN